MEIVGLSVFGLMMAASALVAVKRIKTKKSVKDLFLILSIVAFLIALRMVLRIIGG